MKGRAIKLVEEHMNGRTAELFANLIEDESDEKILQIANKLFSQVFGRKYANKIIQSLKISEA